MKAYIDLIRHVLDKGSFKEDRTGVGSLSVFGYQMRFSLQEGFPLVTTKKVHLKSIIHELIWFLKGETNIQYLVDNNISIWNEWADENGNLGPVYGKQWRTWETRTGETIDQISQVIESIKTNPDSRRHIVSAWNVEDVPKMKLPPCHLLFQFYVNNGTLSCLMYQRSADIFLGLPFNIASYALLTMMMAQVCNLQYGDLVISLGDAHIYKNHIEQVHTQILREPYPLPTLKINPNIHAIFDFSYSDFELIKYQAHPHIKGSVAI